MRYCQIQKFKMLNRLLPFTILTLCANALWAQSPQNINLETGGQLGSQSHLMACPDQFAGTISFTNFVGQSNDIDLDTIYFCFNDQIDIVHNGDQDLTGDPDPSSPPGITYGFFDCPPTISGPNLDAVLSEPCITVDGIIPPTNGIYVTAGGSASGSINFANDGGIQNFYNNGNPVLLWFAPLTIDNFTIKQYETDLNTGEVGPCVNLNVSEAFAVVYLNEIETSNLSVLPNSSGCGGQFDVRGGLPEFDGSTYTDISITLVGNTSITGTVISNPATHGGTIQFTVPTPGLYDVTIEDGKSCGATIENFDLTNCTSVSLSAENLTAAPGDNICVEITVESGFTDIVSMQYGLTWDPTILSFTSITGLTPNLPDYTVPSNFNVVNDTLIFAWASFAGTGATLPPSETLYEVCFTVIGTDGDCSGIQYVTPEGSTIEVVNENGAVLGFNGIDGEVCVSNPALMVGIVQDSVSCYEGSDGSFTTTVSGGMAPYSVTWQPIGGGPMGGPGTINIDGGSFTANGLEAGTYNVTITDDTAGSPLTVFETIEVLAPPVIFINFSINPGPCHGDLGSIAAILVLDSNQVFNPLNNYTYEWNNMETGVTSISNLTSGTYSLTVTEISTGCTVSNTAFLNENEALSAMTVYDTSSCSGVADGTISISVSGGAPDVNGNYTIELPTAGNGVNVMNNVTNVNNLASGTYPLIITDANGCTLEQDLFLPAIKVLSLNAQIDSIDCNDACSGGLFLTGITNGGIPGTPYSFDWFGMPTPPPPNNVTGTTLSFGNLCEGTYWVEMTDTDGCTIVDTFAFSEPEPINLSLLNVVDETCDPGMDGSITIGVDGGVWPYTYNWNNPSTDSIATGLAAGAYTVTVEDVSGCFDTLTATVNSPAPPMILNFPNDTINCFAGNDGTLTVTASADVISYDWSNGAIGPTASVLTSGEYIVTVTNDDACTATDTAYVIAPPILTLDSIVLELPQCPGQGGGGLIAFVSGGTADYSYLWSNGGNGSANIGSTIVSGNYSVTINDANLCGPIIVDTFLPDPPIIELDFLALDSASCFATDQMCDGGATASAMYSDGNTGTFNFNWQDVFSENGVMTSSSTPVLCAGENFVTVSDGVCSIVDTFDIPAPLPIAPNSEIQPVSCNGLTDGSITVSPSGGSAPFDIVWGGGQMGTTIDMLPTGFYSVAITDANGCFFEQDSLEIDEPEPLVLQLNTSETFNVSCAGFANGIISVFAEGGNIQPGVDPVFVWENNIAAPSESIATELAAGSYTVTVIDEKGCEDSLEVTLIEPEPIQFVLGDFEPITCFGQSTFITVDSAWGGSTSIYQYSIGGGLERSLGELSEVYAGDYEIQVFTITDELCTADTTITITQPVELMIQMPDVLAIELGDSLTMIVPQITPPVPIDSFLWAPPFGLSCTDCKNPTVDSITQDQVYELTIWDINGCTATAEILIDLDRNRNVYIPNIFSPNGDGINDKFQVFTGQGVTQINFVKIYDRWGELVFEEPGAPFPSTPDGTSGWDGRFGGDTMNPATFLYLVEVEFFDGQVLLYRGDVTIIR